MQQDIAVIGIGLSRWGELWEQSLRDIFVESALHAIKDSGVDHIDSMYVGSMSPGLFNNQEHLAALLADYLGVGSIPSTRVESACASGGLAMKMACLDIMSGTSEIVLAGGVEKMTDVDTDGATLALASAADYAYEVYQGVTFPGLYAMIARMHMDKYGTTEQQLAEVAVKNHLHGSMNSMAQFPQKINVDAVLNSVVIADPLHILDCSPITDGAAAVILCSAEKARQLKLHPQIRISGLGHATDTMALHSREDITALSAVEKAGITALKMSGKKIDDIDLFEVHDCFTIAEICILEALGLFPKGKGGNAAASGKTRFDGPMPVNTSGGLKAKGHPVGATGIAQIVEIVTQLREQAGERQVKNARVGLTQNMGGSGGSCLVHILEAV
ncbi:MAG: thiolase domain-containing protein [Caldithrix sp.]|nr:thiolase domain-containing protein [Caldithrix sp.]